jgi:hypothetical protein
MHVLLNNNKGINLPRPGINIPRILNLHFSNVQYIKKGGWFDHALRHYICNNKVQGVSKKGDL